MRLKELFTDAEAVSPVIGVILMIVTILILSAVIASFVLGLSNQVGSTYPTANFTFAFTNQDSNPYDYVEITHDRGNTITSDRLTVTSDTAIDLATSASNIDRGDTSTSEAFTDTDGLGSDVNVTSGTTVVVGPGADSSELNNATIRVIWESQTGNRSSTLAEWTGPDA